jgi:hypothetical protein
MAAEKRSLKKASNSKYKIKIIKNGPDIVTGGVPLWEKS